MSVDIQYIIEQCDSFQRQCEIDKVPPSLTRLALHLGAESVDHIYELRLLDEKLSGAINQALLEVEHFYEKGLLDKATVTGSQFALKRMGWVENKVNVDVKHSLEEGLDLKSMDDEALISLLQTIKKNAPSTG